MSKQSAESGHQYSESAYFLNEDKQRHPAVGSWCVGFCDGFCNSCCSSFVPTFVPCVGIAVAATAITNPSRAVLVGLVFCLLYLGASVFDLLLLLANVLQPNGSLRRFSSAADDATADIVVGSALCSVLYFAGLWDFRGCFRGELRLPSNCCCDYSRPAYAPAASWCRCARTSSAVNE